MKNVVAVVVLCGLVGALGMVTMAWSIAAKPKPEPRITKSERFILQGCDKENDPLSLCVGERLTLENPLYKPVVFTIRCGSDFDEQDVTINGGVTQVVEIELTIPPQSEQVCKVASWCVVGKCYK